MHRDNFAAAQARIEALEEELDEMRSARSPAAFEELYHRLRTVRDELNEARAENAELRERLRNALREKLILEQRAEAMMKKTSGRQG